MLPTFYAASGLSVTDMLISLGFFLILYTTLLVVMIVLMVKTIKAGPGDYDMLEGTDEPGDLPNSVAA